MVEYRHVYAALAVTFLVKIFQPTSFPGGQKLRGGGLSTQKSKQLSFQETTKYKLLAEDKNIRLVSFNVTVGNYCCNSVACFSSIFPWFTSFHASVLDHSLARFPKFFCCRYFYSCCFSLGSSASLLLLSFCVFFWFLMVLLPFLLGFFTV